jgi:hypothetical protein
METWIRSRAGSCNALEWASRAVLLVSLLSTSGCLMPAPPELSDPERTRPYVHYLKVDPPLGEPIQVNLSDIDSRVYPILLPFQSEDLGEDVAGYLHLVEPDNTVTLQTNSDRSPAGEFSTVRNIRMDWTVTLRDPGCYRLIATLAHASSFGAGGRIPEENLDDAEAVSWLANVYKDDAPDVTLNECPRVGGVN